MSILVGSVGERQDDDRANARRCRVIVSDKPRSPRRLTRANSSVRSNSEIRVETGQRSKRTFSPRFRRDARRGDVGPIADVRRTLRGRSGSGTRA